ncbi:unnamed protein product [Protopolystoma xenopodis]|uniref:Uncharacterized protein n=1 Tax=Protopolystoma xenopodis TaxID=117903 RepID=A0A448WXJ9_9PLAT|nr:unnamed protein product [Protopolystoma xenopodis]
MTPSSDDVHHLMGASSARFHPKRGWRSRGPRQPKRRIRAKWLQNNAINPSSFSGQIDQRISSLGTFIRNESAPNNNCGQVTIYGINSYRENAISFRNILFYAVTAYKVM